MILYLGNILSLQGSSPAMMELVVKKLAENHVINLFSSKRNKFFRFLDMAIAIIKNNKIASLIIIDVYSSQAFWFAVMIALISRILRIPYVPVLRGGDLPVRITKTIFFSNVVFKHSAINISPSQYLKIGLRKYGYKVIVIPNFIEIEKYPTTVRKKFRPRLLWVRSFHAVYNPMLAIHLVNDLKRKYQDVKLCMIGPDKDGSLSEIKTMAKDLDIEENITFMGKLDKSEWIEVASEYDIFINTTNFDNMPVSVIEAMALGLPVISTNVGGIPYLISNEMDGLLVAKNDLPGFIMAVERIVENPLFGENLATAGRAKAENFSWEYVGPIWNKVIHQFKKA